MERYRNREIRVLKRFSAGLARDIEAIENVVAYDYSNGFVEGMNSRLKMVKRTMYLCGKSLLEAKLIYKNRCERTIAEEPAALEYSWQILLKTL